MLKTFQPTNSKQNATNNLNNKNSNSQLKTTWPPPNDDQKYGWKCLGRRYGTILLPPKSQHKKNKETEKN